MSERTQKHIAAMSAGGRAKIWVHNGVSLWSNGWIILPGSAENAVPYESIASVWEKISQREDKWLSVGATTYADGENFMRKLFSEDGRTFVVNEAFWRMISDLGMPFGTNEMEPVAIRKDGALQALVMCMRAAPRESQIVDSATDSQVFEKFSCEENGWYLQGAQKLRDELAKIEEEISEKEEKAAGLKAEIEGLEGYADSLREKIRAAKAEESVSA